MKQRYHDLPTLAREEGDFIKRTIRPGASKILAGVLIACVLLVAAIYNVDKIGPETLIALVISIFLMLVAFTTLFMDSVQESVLSNEFENLLFAGAASSGSEFCLILRKNRQIVYFNPGFHKYFTYTPQVQEEGFESLLEKYGLDKDGRMKLLEAIDEQKKTKINFQYRDLTGGKQKLILLLEPIARPNDYYVLRGIRPENYKEISEAFSRALNSGDGVLDQLMDELPWAAYVANEEGLIEYTNQAMNAMLSYAEDEIVKKRINFGEILFGADEIEHSFQHGWAGEIALKNRRGDPIKVKLKQILVPTKDGEGYQRYGFFERSDISTLLRMPMASNSTSAVPISTDEIWNRFLEHSPIAIAMLDSSGIVSESNVVFRDLTEIKDGNRGGWNLLQFVSKEDMNAVSSLLQNLKKGMISDSKPIEIELVTQKKKTVSLYISPYYAANPITHFIAYLIDTTEQKNLEQRFVHSQKMQAVGQLAGGIAHDFNNLLTAIIGFCDLLLIRHPPGDQSFADIMQVKQNSNRAANLVRQLLAFSRKQTLQPETLDITGVLAELSNLIRRLIGENIELKLHHGRDLGLIRVDQGQLEQVLINLAVNARDAMSDGGVLTIETSSVRLEHDNDIDPDLVPPSQDEIIPRGQYVCLKIIDSGHGIPKHIIPHIFEPFYTTKEVGSGTGLGLSTVYGIIKQTGGYIYVSSTEGKGAEFVLFFKQHALEEANALENMSGDKEDKQDLTGSGTVLLVEDEAPVRIFSARALRNKGYSVLEADCGEAALMIMEEKGDAINLIISDVVMPGITGPDMVKQVLEKHPNIKVIFISGYAEDAFLKSFGSERSFNFLPKPYSLKQLAGKVKEVMAERS